ncbi:MAG: MBL fold metallo-hydrolase [Clostridia bacterium]|nr:MBL fold metallo-hydrolase [Clostridia bacterium]
MAKGMSKRKKQKLIKGVLTVIAIIALMIIWLLKPSNGGNRGNYDVSEGSAEFHFIDVGQGDATLIIVDGKNVLIDTGDKEARDALTDYLDSHGVDEIEYFVITHFDEDHYGVASHVLKNYDVKNVIMPNQVKEGTTYEAFIETLGEQQADKGVNVMNASEYIGKTISVGGREAVRDENGNEIEKARNGVKFKILAPLGEEYEDSNDYSIVMMAQFGNKKVLLTGDAEKKSEAEIVKAYDMIALDCDILKVGHHGSITSTTNELLTKAQPEIAVISCGKDNEYGHPHPEVVARLEKIDGIEIYITAEHGSVVFTIADDTIIKK